ncbi:hypothetical protein SRABI128_03719 [Microbacterium sp. Bi128]|nr:hypothetical protein SRABI128_03719 [Microbacterium sp. Bi128]
MLIQTAPKSRSRLRRMAVPWFVVQTLEARAYSTSLASSTASSSVLNFCTVMTGPNVSFWTMSSLCLAPVTMVGSKKKPFSPARWPPVSILQFAGRCSTTEVTALKWLTLFSGPK